MKVRIVEGVAHLAEFPEVEVSVLRPQWWTQDGEVVWEGGVYPSSQWGWERAVEEVIDLYRACSIGWEEVWKATDWGL